MSIRFINSGSGGGGFPPDWTQIGYSNTPDFITNNFNYAKTIYDNWDNTQTNLANKFLSNVDIVYMPLVDTSNATNISGFFSWCSNLEYVPNLDTSNATNTYAMFNQCTSLINIPQLDISKSTNLTNMFTNCPKLNDESLDNILKMCINATAYTGTKKLNFLGMSNSANPSSRIQVLPSYQDFLDAGWTIGY